MYFKKTRCPYCKTLYRITLDQLTIGHGQVLCGMCREMFNAIEYLNNSEISDEQNEINMQISLDEYDVNEMYHHEIIKFFQQKNSKSSMNLLEYLNQLDK